MNNRDLDLNGCFMGSDGLTYSTQALEAARTGKINIVATKRGIYGSEVFYHEGTRLIKNRGIMRYLKTVAEGKAQSFEFLPVNEQVNLGIYWLVLAKRMSRKENAPEIMDKLFYLGRQIQQTEEGEEHIYDVLDRVHTKYPFFDFDGKPLDKTGLARWLHRKFLRQIDKKYRDKNSIPTNLTLTRSEEDTIPYTVSLDAYSSRPDKLEKIKNGWDTFLRRSRRRTSQFHEGADDSDEIEVE